MVSRLLCLFGRCIPSDFLCLLYRRIVLVYWATTMFLPLFVVLLAPALLNSEYLALAS